MSKNLLSITLLAAFTFSGCAATDPNNYKPPTPSALEKLLYETQTNGFIPQVRTVTNDIVRTNFITVTNFVPVIVERTNYSIVTNATLNADGTAGPVTFKAMIEAATNFIAQVATQAQIFASQQITKETNQVPLVMLVPKADREEQIKTFGAFIGNIWGMGSVVSLGLGALISGWAKIRNGKKFEALVQGTETIREVVAQTAGRDGKDAITTFLKDHQAESGVFDSIAALVKKYADTPAAKEDAKAIVSEIAGTVPKPI